MNVWPRQILAILTILLCSLISFSTMVNSKWTQWHQKSLCARYLRVSATTATMSRCGRPWWHIKTVVLQLDPFSFCSLSSIYITTFFIMMPGHRSSENQSYLSKVNDWIPNVPSPHKKSTSNIVRVVALQFMLIFSQKTHRLRPSPPLPVALLTSMPRRVHLSLRTTRATLRVTLPLPLPYVGSI